METGLRKPSRLVLTIVLVVLVASTAYAILKPVANRYRFIRVSHPVSMMLDDTGKWTYYSLSTPAEEVARQARAELLAEGFQESTNDKPWFRFSKGDREVIVCNHDEIMTVADRRRSTLRHSHWPKSLGAPKPQAWGVVWVHEPGGNPAQLAVFNVKRLVLGW
ncbi:MAG: hypothetical protein QOJ65_2397 [Fimbriimonadaceae bacterium]|jgi:hypothetical protein|nr:hypothetical protein [Fimbriimonadaceae bacterium]